MKLISYFRLCRLHYSVPMALTFLLTVYYARGGEMGDVWPVAWTATAALGLLISGAYVLNDAADVEFDRLGAPDRPIPAGQVSGTAATVVGLGLWVLGVAVGSFVGSAAFPPVFWTVAMGLLLYDAFSKRLGVGKQWMVAMLMTSLYPLAIGFSGGAWGSRAWTLLPFSVWMFLSSYAFELLRDIRDRKTDAQVLRRKNRVQRRPRTWLFVASWLILLGAAALVGPVFLGCRTLYAAGLPVVLIVAIWAAVRRHYEPKIKLLYVEFVLVGVLATLDVIVYGF
ncbi:MAG: UbiA family prenyltransferase [Phycisphaerae bacterium]|nr:UbiA family prenyltransferase [Phycisphaerae bacterium]